MAKTSDKPADKDKKKKPAAAKPKAEAKPKAAVKKAAAPKAAPKTAVVKEAPKKESTPAAAKPAPAASKAAPAAPVKPAVVQAPAAAKPAAAAVPAAKAPSAAVPPKSPAAAPQSVPPKAAPAAAPVPPRPAVPPQAAPRPSVPPSSAAPARPQTPAAPVPPRPQQPQSAPQAPARPSAPAPQAPRPAQPAQPSYQAPRPAYQASPAVAQAAPAAPKPAAPAPSKKLPLRAPISVKDLSEKLQARPTDLIAKLIKMGIFANINQSINYETAAKLAADFGFVPERAEELQAAAETAPAPTKHDAKNLTSRPPIVTMMGHVDHGKTSLLDAIRKTRVAAGEAGGITQHIGAYEVFLEKGAVTFLDTPGHEAFTEMRSRGAKATDIVVLVVAADDGIMPQTEEAIDHAKAADATIVVAINKIDLPGANIEKVKKELSQHDLLPEDWGGKTITVGVSAKTGAGIDQLLEMLLLESEVLELKANPQAPAEGVVIEAQLSKGSGPVATVLIQDGTLRIGDTVVCGDYYGKVRAMINDRGARVREALPSAPVEISGLSGVPRAGDRFYTVESEVKAREILEQKKRKASEGARAHITLEDAYSEITAGKSNALKLIIKSDVQGSIEALRGTLMQIPTTEVKLQIIHTGIGSITKSDVMLAAASNAIIIGFHVNLEPDADAAMKLEQVDVRLYEIIYEVKSAIEKAVNGMLTPETKEVVVGTAEVRQLFKTSKFGMIAGSMVLKGKIVRNFSCRILRGGKKVHEGKVSGLKRFKDDVREVQEGFECGIIVSNFKEYAEGDRVEIYEIQTKEKAA